MEKKLHFDNRFENSLTYPPIAKHSKMTKLIRGTARVALVGTLVVTAMAVTFVADRAAGADAAGADVSRQQVWLLSTRQAPRRGDLEAGDEHIKFWQRTDRRHWEPAARKDLIEQSDPAVPTVVFIHGNRSDLNDAVREGLPVYHHLRCRAEGRPFRFVIWAWPADRVRGGVRTDARVKACYSDVQSYYLADWLGRLDPDGSVNLIGYSFGARIVSGALHLLGGGRVAGRSLPGETNRKHGPLRAVLVAAAMDADWLLPSRRNGLALSQVDRLLMTRNARDPVLKLYRLMNGRGGPAAMGYKGPACSGQLGPDREKLEVFSIANSVGRSHAWTSHLASAGLRRQFARLTFTETQTTP